MSGNLEVIVNDDNFKQEVLESDVPVLVDFWAEWCGPCRMAAPIVEEIAREYRGKIRVCKLNVDEEPEIATEYAVMSIPTLIIFKNGDIMETKIGVMDKRGLEKLVQPYI